MTHRMHYVFGLFALWFSLSALGAPPSFNITENPQRTIERAQNLDCERSPRQCRYIAAVEMASYVSACPNIWAQRTGNTLMRSDLRAAQQTLENWAALSDPELRRAVLHPDNRLRRFLVIAHTRSLTQVSMQDLDAVCMRMSYVQQQHAPEPYSAILQGDTQGLLHFGSQQTAGRPMHAPDPGRFGRYADGTPIYSNAGTGADPYGEQYPNRGHAQPQSNAQLWEEFLRNNSVRFPVDGAVVLSNHHSESTVSSTFFTLRTSNGFLWKDTLPFNKDKMSTFYEAPCKGVQSHSGPCFDPSTRVLITLSRTTSCRGLVLTESKEARMVEHTSKGGITTRETPAPASTSMCLVPKMDGTFEEGAVRLPNSLTGQNYSIYLAPTR